MKDNQNIKRKITSVAWDLFYKKGYDNTTIDEIIRKSNVSKGSFYYYFDSKEDLMQSLPILFDSKYEALLESLDPSLDSVEKLATLSAEMFFTLENSVPVQLLKTVMMSLVTSSKNQELINPDRVYFRIIRQLIIEGKENGTFLEEYSVNEILIAYSLLERGIMYDWAISNGNYALASYAHKIIRTILTGFTIPSDTKF